jgi:SecD/SecF fusion protein
LLAVAALMIGVYRFWGVVAMAAVLFNILIMWGVLQNFGAAITLPGIAGIVLTIGMAVDANVLVFERFKEEFLLSGKLFSSMKAAYAKAFSAIADSNITTIIAALILLQFDSGPIKGFAVTLIIGIVSSMFTALFMTKYFFSVYLKDRKEEKLNMVNLFSDSHFNFLKYAKLAAVLTLFVVVSGGVLFFKQTHTIFGMDFTGGYSLTLTVDEQPGLSSYISKVEEALLASGAHANDIDIRQLNRPEQLKIFLSTAMEEPGRPFYHLPEKNKESVLNYKYQQNPRLAWVIGALEKGGITISSEEKSELQDNWSVMSGQFSHVMRNNALLALTFALVSILIYITIRFEFNYALAAVLALAHDVLVTLSLVAFFHWIGFPVQINLEIIGAIMTIIGYALNDTIIIFDRIREDLYLHKKWSLPKLMNHALNVTLSRTLMTSGTTLAVLFTLVLMGGKSIFGFSFVMMIGVLVGTLSSLFVAAPLLLFLQTGSLQGDSKRNGAANTPIQMNG